MRTSTLLSRASALSMGLSAIWNVAFSLSFVVLLSWVGVGLLWLVPLALGLVELALAISVWIGGPRRATLAGPTLGVLVSLMNFNFLALLVDAVSLTTTLGAFRTHRAEVPSA